FGVDRFNHWNASFRVAERPRSRPCRRPVSGCVSRYTGEYLPDPTTPCQGGVGRFPLRESPSLRASWASVQVVLAKRTAVCHDSTPAAGTISAPPWRGDSAVAKRKPKPKPKGAPACDEPSTEGHDKDRQERPVARTRSTGERLRSVLEDA